MRDLQELGMILVAVVAAGCVPTPANLGTPTTDPSPASISPTATPTPAGPTPSPSFVRPTPLPSPDFVAYKVVRGDTLEKIADRFATTGRSIAYWNRVTYPSLDPDSPDYQPDRIERGWVLLLIPGSEVDPEELPTLSPAPTPKPTPSPASTLTASPSP